MTLHSTMFLLIQAGNKISIRAQYFTFHNVSINTGITYYDCSSLIFYFTFHNVSINTDSIAGFSVDTAIFTFHNVSINTPAASSREKWKENALHSTMFLLILSGKK